MGKQLLHPEGEVDRLSPYIFILCAEIWAKKLRENNDIKGITVRGNEIKISQYADDKTTILDSSKKSFTSALLDLKLFGEISGLRPNNKKMKILWTYVRKRSQMGYRQT